MLLLFPVFLHRKYLEISVDRLSSVIPRSHYLPSASALLSSNQYKEMPNNLRGTMVNFWLFSSLIHIMTSIIRYSKFRKRNYVTFMFFFYCLDSFNSGLQCPRIIQFETSLLIQANPFILTTTPSIIQHSKVIFTFRSMNLL